MRLKIVGQKQFWNIFFFYGRIILLITVILMIILQLSHMKFDFALEVTNIDSS